MTGIALSRHEVESAAAETAAESEVRTERIEMLFALDTKIQALVDAGRLDLAASVAALGGYDDDEHLDFFPAPRRDRTRT